MYHGMRGKTEFQSTHYQQVCQHVYALRMTVALVHELLTMKGGAERVLRIFSQMFPDAPIYTLLYDEQKLGDWFPTARIRASHLQRWAGLLNYSLPTTHYSLGPAAMPSSSTSSISPSSLASLASLDSLASFKTLPEPLPLSYTHIA